MSIRLRLNLRRTALLALVLAAFAAIICVVVARQETDRLDAALHDQAEAIERASAESLHGGFDRGGVARGDPHGPANGRDRGGFDREGRGGAAAEPDRDVRDGGPADENAAAAGSSGLPASQPETREPSVTGTPALSDGLRVTASDRGPSAAPGGA